jgi:hypothetical protein
VADTTCAWCNGQAENGLAYIMSAPNTCTACGSTQFRSSNTTCSVCAKDNTCASATCQGGSGLTRMYGGPSISSVYTPALNGINLAILLSRYADGITTFDTPIQIHAGTTVAETTNPWFQLDLGANTQANIDNIVFYNRDGQWGCRTFAPNDGTCASVYNDPTLVWNAVGQGAYIGLSDQPLSILNPNFATGQCTGPSSRNCRCGWLTVYNATNDGAGA